MSDTTIGLPGLTSRDRLVLADVTYDVHLIDLIQTVHISQVYRNADEKNIEAVYTLPLPLDATLLEMKVQIGERVLVGVVTPKKKAEETYEEAIETGDSAFLLVEAAPGLYTMNVGNLMPGEEARIEIQYAELLRWMGDQIRLRIPTTIAPRYGAPSLHPHEVPEFTMEDLRMRIRLTVEGSLSHAQITCPTHSVAFDRSNGTSARLELDRLLMDRDVVFLIEGSEEHRASASAARDGEGWVVHASFCPHFEGEVAARNLKIVVDCSGSMGGDSIRQARIGVLRILDLLRPEDRFNIMAFGSHATTLFTSSRPADPPAVAEARGWVRALDANMGGTEMFGALNRMMEMAPNRGADILLITDGEVWRHEDIVNLSRKSNHRLFTVGVGSAPNEALLSSLSKQTGGACEMVTPNEDMPGRIEHHARRMFRKAESAKVVWPISPLHMSPAQLDSVFSDDTVHVFGWFAEEPGGEVRLNLNAAPIQAAPIHPDAEGTVMPRLAAAERMHDVHSEEEKTRLALQYGLVTPWTSLVVVLERADKAQEIPDVIKVRHTLAAGWHGMGTVGRGAMEMTSYSLLAFEDLGDVPPASMPPRPLSSSGPMNKAFRGLSRFRRVPPPSHAVLSFRPADFGPLDQHRTITDLKMAGFEARFLDGLRRLVRDGLDEELVVAVFLDLWIDKQAEGAVDRQTRRQVGMRARRLAGAESEQIRKRVASECGL